jgi:Flp pilus assembly protein TadD
VKSPQRRIALGLAFVAVAIAAGIGGALWIRRAPLSAPSGDLPYAARPKGSLTYHRDIAPLIYQHCSPCHRAGETAPFELLTYEDVRKRVRQITEVTAGRYMPPFLPEPGPLPFANARRLTSEQIGLINQWAAEGAREGAPADAPPRPTWTQGWQLGPPDVVVQMPQPFEVPAEGKDVYRNFVVPAPVSHRHFVRAVEFRAGTRAIHHVFIQMDRTRNSRRRDEADPGVGFSGMDSPVTVESPSGHFLSWQPGRGPTEMPPGLPWTLEPGTDLVLQMHLQPTGKPEAIQSTIGLYFTPQAPTNTPFKIALSSYAIDIPAGNASYTVEDDLTLPVDVDLLAVLPHAHYLARRLEGRATLPDGTSLALLTIPQWNFDWQSDFRYREPVFLPKGTRLSMRYTYDNSASNARNPHQPPQRVRYGLNSTDEMGELWFQLLARTPEDLSRLQGGYLRRMAEDSLTYNQFLLQQDPNNARAHNHLGNALVTLGRPAEALQHFRTAARLKPDYDEARYHLGVMAALAKNVPEAEIQFLAAIAANPEHYKARNNLGKIYLDQRRIEDARVQFQEVLRLNPGDPIATANLQLLQRVGAP